MPRLAIDAHARNGKKEDTAIDHDEEEATRVGSSRGSSIGGVNN